MLAFYVQCSLKDFTSHSSFPCLQTIVHTCFLLGSIFYLYIFYRKCLQDTIFNLKQKTFWLFGCSFLWKPFLGTFNLKTFKNTSKTVHLLSYATLNYTNAIVVKNGYVMCMHVMCSVYEYLTTKTTRVDNFLLHSEISYHCPACHLFLKM